jgi:hypothetical protein
VRKLALTSLLILALGLAACGGGSSSTGSSSGGSGSTSTSSSTSTTAESKSPQAAWASEITGVMNEFENSSAAQVIEQIHTSTAQMNLEPLYAAYSVNLQVLAKKIEKTAAPASCVALRKKMAGYTRQVSALTKSLSNNSELSPEQYALRAYKQGLKIDRLGHQLGAAAAEPHC